MFVEPPAVTAVNVRGPTEVGSGAANGAGGDPTYARRLFAAEAGAHKTVAAIPAAETIEITLRAVSDRSNKWVAC